MSNDIISFHVYVNLIFALREALTCYNFTDKKGKYLLLRSRNFAFSVTRIFTNLILPYEYTKHSHLHPPIPYTYIKHSHLHPPYTCVITPTFFPVPTSHTFCIHIPAQLPCSTMSTHSDIGKPYRAPFTNKLHICILIKHRRKLAGCCNKWCSQTPFLVIRILSFIGNLSPRAFGWVGEIYKSEFKTTLSDSLVTYNSKHENIWIHSQKKKLLKRFFDCSLYGTPKQESRKLRCLTPDFRFVVLLGRGVTGVTCLSFPSSSLSLSLSLSLL